MKVLFALLFLVSCAKDKVDLEPPAQPVSSIKPAPYHPYYLMCYEGTVWQTVVLSPQFDKDGKPVTCATGTLE